MDNIYKEFLNDVFKGCSAVETNRGTKSVWRILVKNGWVEKMKFGGLLGHEHSYTLTKAGKEYMEAVKV